MGAYVQAVGEYLSASWTRWVMRACGMGEVFVSVYTERRLAMASRNGSVDAMV